MTPQEMSRWFEDQVKLKGYKDKYIDEKEEQDILEKAVEKGISLEAARSALVRVCEAQDYVAESLVFEKVKEVIETFAGNDGKIDEKEFKDAVTICMKACKGKKNELECKRMVVTMIDGGAMRVKTGFFSNWYSRIKKEVGL